MLDADKRLLEEETRKLREEKSESIKLLNLALDEVVEMKRLEAELGRSVARAVVLL